MFIEFLTLSKIFYLHVELILHHISLLFNFKYRKNHEKLYCLNQTNLFFILHIPLHHLNSKLLEGHPQILIAYPDPFFLIYNSYKFQFN